MRYTDLKENYSPEDDEYTNTDIDDTRKVRLTLEHLSKLRKIREYRKYQKGIEAVQVSKQYGASGGDDSGGAEL